MKFCFESLKIWELKQRESLDIGVKIEKEID